MSSNSTAPLLPDHPLTHTTPVFVPSLHRVAHMAVRGLLAMSPSLSVSIAERFRSSYDSTPSPTCLVRKRYRDTSKLILDIDSEGDELRDEEDEEEGVEKSSNLDSESEDAEDEGPTAEDEDPAAEDEGLAIGDEGPSMRVESLGLGGDEAVLEGQKQAASVVETTMDEPLGLGYGPLRRQEIAVGEGRMPSVFEVDPEDGIAYIDVPAYPPPPAPVQTSPSPEWSSGSLSIPQAPYIVPLPILSPMISLTIPSPVASPATAEAKGFLNELGARLRCGRIDS
nr:hypothetical protein [Tanacetum cinerariifolium]